MKYCTKCGKELHDEAVICIGCGCSTEEKTRTNSYAQANLNILNTLSQRVYTDSIIWIVIGAIQIITGVFFIVGILNIVNAVNDLKYSKELQTNPCGIVEKYEPIVLPIIIFAYNLIFGGIIGIVGSIYYFVAIRNFVMEHKEEFLALDK